MFPLFVSGSHEDYDLVLKTIDDLKNLDYTITYNILEKIRESPNKDSCTMDRLEKIKESSALVAIIDKSNQFYCDVVSDISFALSLGVPVFMYTSKYIGDNSSYFWSCQKINKFDNMDTLKESLSQVNPKFPNPIDFQKAKQISENHRKTTSDRTLNLIKKMINNGSRKGHKYLNFHVKNKNQDIKYITDELTKLKFPVTYDGNTIKITWG